MTTTTINDQGFQKIISQMVELLGIERIASVLSVSKPTVQRWVEGRNLAHRLIRPRIVQVLEREVGECTS